MQSGQNTPRKVFQNVAIFVLAGTVVCVQFERALPQANVVKMVVLTMLGAKTLH